MLNKPNFLQFHCRYSRENEKVLYFCCDTNKIYRVHFGSFDHDIFEFHSQIYSDAPTRPQAQRTQMCIEHGK